MDMLTRTEMTHRLGQDPAEWTFFGQCYDAGPGNLRQCAVTHEETRIVFTIKPKSGKGRAYISVEAIKQFERWNADLYVKLMAGHQFLQLRTKEVDRAIVAQQEINRLRAAERSLGVIKSIARKRIDKYRQVIKRGDLPEYLENMKRLLQTPAPYFQGDDARALWFEQRAVNIEKALFVVPETDFPTTPEKISAYQPIPEIEF